MDTGYAPAKTVYQELRSALAPWTKSHGFRRWPGTQAGWQKPIGAAQLLGFKFEGYSLLNPDIGSSLAGLVQLEAQEQAAAGPIRQAPFSCCLGRVELDRLARIQGAINQRRPPLPPYLERDAREESLLGHHLRELYQPAPEYREGQLVSFAYYSIENVRDLVGFIVAVLPGALERFLEGRVAKPIDTTPPHLRPNWLKAAPQPSDSDSSTG
jgi:hypothetical protein